jgi:hypothetical protein
MNNKHVVRAKSLDKMARIPEHAVYEIFTVVKSIMSKKTKTKSKRSTSPEARAPRSSTPIPEDYLTDKQISEKDRLSREKMAALRREAKADKLARRQEDRSAQLPLVIFKKMGDFDTTRVAKQSVKAIGPPTSTFESFVGVAAGNVEGGRIEMEIDPLASVKRAGGSGAPAHKFTIAKEVRLKNPSDTVGIPKVIVLRVGAVRSDPRHRKDTFSAAAPYKASGATDNGGKKRGKG